MQVHVGDGEEAWWCWGEGVQRKCVCIQDSVLCPVWSCMYYLLLPVLLSIVTVIIIVNLIVR